jgi:hypothetical protein
LYKRKFHAAALIGTKLEYADLTNARIYGISAWDVRLQHAVQRDLMSRPCPTEISSVTSSVEALMRVTTLRLARSPSTEALTSVPHVKGGLPEISPARGRITIRTRMPFASAVDRSARVCPIKEIIWLAAAGRLEPPQRGARYLDGSPSIGPASDVILWTAKIDVD